jgi:hypothetical protein
VRRDSPRGKLLGLAGFALGSESSRPLLLSTAASWGSRASSSGRVCVCTLSLFIQTLSRSSRCCSRPRLVFGGRRRILSQVSLRWYVVGTDESAAPLLVVAAEESWVNCLIGRALAQLELALAPPYPAVPRIFFAAKTI